MTTRHVKPNATSSKSNGVTVRWTGAVTIDPDTCERLLGVYLQHVNPGFTLPISICSGENSRPLSEHPNFNWVCECDDRSTKKCNLCTSESLEEIMFEEKKTDGKSRRTHPSQKKEEEKKEEKNSEEKPRVPVVGATPCNVCEYSSSSEDEAMMFEERKTDGKPRKVHPSQRKEEEKPKVHFEASTPVLDATACPGNSTSARSEKAERPGDLSLGGIEEILRMMGLPPQRGSPTSASPPSVPAPAPSRGPTSQDLLGNLFLQMISQGSRPSVSAPVHQSPPATNPSSPSPQGTTGAVDRPLDLAGMIVGLQSLLSNNRQPSPSRNRST